MPSPSSKPQALTVILSCGAITLSLWSAYRATGQRKAAEAAKASAERSAQEARRTLEEAQVKLVVCQWASKIGVVDQFATRMVDGNTAKAEVAFKDGRLARLELSGHEHMRLGDPTTKTGAITIPEGSKIWGTVAQDGDLSKFVAHDLELPWLVSKVVIDGPSFDPEKKVVQLPRRNILKPE